MAAILGVSKWATPLTVWNAKTGGDVPDAGSLAARRGLALEPFIAEEFVREHPEFVVYRSKPIVRDDWGIPHITGKTDADAVFGLMYAQAEDDFNRVETNFINAMGRLAEAEGVVMTELGPVAVSWTRTEDLFTLLVDLPHRAMVVVPASRPGSVRIEPSEGAQEPKPLGVQGRAAVYEAGPGKYTFAAPCS